MRRRFDGRQQNNQRLHVWQVVNDVSQGPPSLTENPGFNSQGWRSSMAVSSGIRWGRLRPLQLTVYVCGSVGGYWGMRVRGNQTCSCLSFFVTFPSISCSPCPHTFSLPQHTCFCHQSNALPKLIDASWSSFFNHQKRFGTIRASGTSHSRTQPGILFQLFGSAYQTLSTTTARLLARVPSTIEGRVSLKSPSWQCPVSTFKAGSASLAIWVAQQPPLFGVSVGWRLQPFQSSFKFPELS